MAKTWGIEDVPLFGFYRFKAHPKDVYRIEQIDLQYAGFAMADASRAQPAKAGTAVKIDSQWWRPEELVQVFEVSVDCQSWQNCEGEVAGAGGTAKRLAAMESALQKQQAATAELRSQVADLLKIVVQGHAPAIAELMSAESKVVLDSGKPETTKDPKAK